MEIISLLTLHENVKVEAGSPQKFMNRYCDYLILPLNMPCARSAAKFLLHGCVGCPLYSVDTKYTFRVALGRAKKRIMAIVDFLPFHDSHPGVAFLWEDLVQYIPPKAHLVALMNLSTESSNEELVNINEPYKEKQYVNRVINNLVLSSSSLYFGFIERTANLSLLNCLIAVLGNNLR